MAAQGTGVAEFNKKIEKFLTDEVGESILNFETNDKFTVFLNGWIEKWRKSLETAKHGKYTGHIASGKLYQSLGSGWEFTILGKAMKVQLILPAYYGATDTGRSPTKNKSGDGALRNALSGPGGWISQRKIVPSKGLSINNEKLNAEESNKALAYLIAAKIHSKGFQGTKWFSKYLPQFDKELSEVVEEIFGKGVRFNLEIFGKK
jgi:hypothetical protein